MRALRYTVWAPTVAVNNGQPGYPAVIRFSRDRKRVGNATAFRLANCSYYPPARIGADIAVQICRIPGLLSAMLKCYNRYKYLYGLWSALAAGGI